VRAIKRVIKDKYIMNRSARIMSRIGILMWILITSNVLEKSVLLAQSNEIDTSYISTYKKALTTRIYGARRYASFHVPSDKQFVYAKFVPNTTFNIGLGATYRNATLNLALGIPGINEVGSKRGKTDYLDLQGYLYPRKFAIDV